MGCLHQTANCSESSRPARNKTPCTSASSTSSCEFSCTNAAIQSTQSRKSSIGGSPAASSTTSTDRLDDSAEYWNYSPSQQRYVVQSGRRCCPTTTPENALYSRRKRPSSVTSRCS